MKYNTNITLTILITLICILVFYLLIRKYKQYDAFTNKYTIADVYLYIFSWKRVNDNAIKTYNIVSKVFPNTYFINCDENFNASALIPSTKIIQLEDSYYFGGQFQEGMRHCPDGKIYGNIVGDVEADKIDWNKMADSLLHAVNNLNAGIFAPDAPNYPHLGEHIEGSYHTVDNTDETIFFIIPELYKNYKNYPYNTKTKYGFGIDIFYCNLANKMGKRTIRDASIKVGTDNVRGYKTQDAMDQMGEFLKDIEIYQE